MKNSKILKIVRTLSKQELKALEQFIQSPIHNKHEDVIKLFKYLKKNIHSSDTKLSKQKVFKHLYPGFPFNMQKVHYVNSYLLKVIEEFLAWQEYQKDKVTQQIYLVQAYNNHFLGDQLEKSFLKGLDYLNTNKIRNSDHYRNLYSLHFKQINYRTTLGRNQKIDLQNLSETLDTFFIIEKLKSSCASANALTMTKSKHDTGLLQNVLDYISEHNLTEIPVIAIYFYAYKALINNEDISAYYQLKANLFKHETLFNLSELRDIYVMALNFCIKKLNKGDHNLIVEIFDLYRSGLKVNVFLENNILSKWTYNNVIIAGLKVKEFEWVKNFIYEYSELLHPDHKEGSFNFNLAKYHYEIGDFKQSMSLLLQMEYDDILHNLGAKTMLAKMYYEMQEKEVLITHLNSFKTYVRRKKNLGYHAENYLNIIEFIKKITLLFYPSKSEVQQLKAEIQNTKVLTEKEWLLTQLQKMS